MQLEARKRNLYAQNGASPPPQACFGTPTGPPTSSIYPSSPVAASLLCCFPRSRYLVFRFFQYECRRGSEREVPIGIPTWHISASPPLLSD